MKRMARRQKRFRTEKWLEEESACVDQHQSKKAKTTIPSACLVIKCAEVTNFFKIFDEPVVQDFLAHDICQRISDKYLIAMTFAYFKRAHLSLDEYTVYNFFLALYLANDMEEDDENFRYEIFPWVLGRKWRDKFPKFLTDRDMLWRRMNYRAAVSCKCCQEIIEVRPRHFVWKRERSESHGGAVRSHIKSHAEREPFPRGPGRSPIPCKSCYPMSVSSGYASGVESDSSDSSTIDCNDSFEITPCAQSPNEIDMAEAKAEESSYDEKSDPFSDDSISMEEKETQGYSIRKISNSFDTLHIPKKNDSVINPVI